MKKLGQLVVGLAFVFGVFSARAQGVIYFNNHIVNTLVTHVYGPETSDPTISISGNGSNDTPAGTIVYTGTPIGGTSTGTYAGQNYTAQIWAVSGTGQPASALQAVTQYTSTFRTQSGTAGLFVVPAQLYTEAPYWDPGIPNTSAGTATLQLRVWDNAGGTVPDWATAISLGGLRGASPTFNLSNLGNIGTPPVVPPILTGLQSFNLYMPGGSGGSINPNVVPEPGTLLLLGIGGAWFGLIRRKKRL